MNHCLIMNFPEKFYIVCVAFWENLAFIFYIYIFLGGGNSHGKAPNYHKHVLSRCHTVLLSDHFGYLLQPCISSGAFPMLKAFQQYITTMSSERIL